MEDFIRRVMIYLPGALRTEVELLSDAYTPLAMERNKELFDKRKEEF
jgi:hypothetical protein